MATKVRFKFKDRNNRPNHSKVLQVACNVLNCPFTRLFDTDDGYKAVCPNTKDVDIIVGHRGIKAFDTIGLTVITPPEVRAQRSIFVRQLDYSFGSNNSDAIKTELEDKNEWMKIDEVVKLGSNTHVMKVRFAETVMADKALSQGFVGFNLSIQPHQIQRERFTNLLICYSCYKWEDHVTNDCPDKIKLCSNCAEEGHVWRDCPHTDARKCCNCKRDNRPGYDTHRTMAMSCPIKKEKIKDKEIKEKQRVEEKRNASYANVAKQTIQQFQTTAPVSPTLELQSELPHQILTCILYAHLQNLSIPGTFESSMNEMLVGNGLSPMKFPKEVNSDQVFRINSRSDTEFTLSLKPAAQTHEHHPISERASERHECDSVTTESSDTSQSDEEIEVEEQPSPLPSASGVQRKQAHEIGLKFYYEDREKPASFVDNKTIIGGIERNKIKFTFKDPNYTVEEVKEALLSKLITVCHKDFQQLSAKQYKTIINGKIIDMPSKSQPSPLPARTHRHRAKK